MTFTFDRDNPFLSGSCHIHAMACVRAHGGHFAILYDYGDPYGTDGDGEDIPAVWHVWSVHETPQGLVARDVTGDVPIDHLTRHALLLFEDDGMDMKMQWGDAHLDDRCPLSEVENLCASDDMPLCAVSEDDIRDALGEPSVTAPPGSRLVILPDPAATFEEESADCTP